jgi:predicted alpha/beta superfamily hydrolase
MPAPDTSRRVRLERGVYRQPNGNYAVCFMLDGKPRLRTINGDLDAARAARARLSIAAQAGLVNADGEKSWVPAQNQFVDLLLSPKMAAAST